MLKLFSLLQASEVMEDFEKTIAQLKQQLLVSEHQRQTQVRVRRAQVHLGLIMCHTLPYLSSGSGFEVPEGKRRITDQPRQKGALCRHV